jgi:hypothetical protein
LITNGAGFLLTAPECRLLAGSRHPRNRQTVIFNEFLAFADKATMLNNKKGHKEANPCHFLTNSNEGM